jgi:hypothetical protein
LGYLARILPLTVDERSVEVRARRHRTGHDLAARRGGGMPGETQLPPLLVVTCAPAAVCPVTAAVGVPESALVRADGAGR